MLEQHHRFALTLQLSLLGLVSLGLAACSNTPAPGWSGYAEGDYVYIAAPLAGRLDGVSVQAGQTVTKGAPLFQLDAESEQAAQQESAARLSSAQAQAANLDTGKRQQELAVARAQLAQARAAESLANSDLLRQRKLVAQGFVSQAREDEAAAQWRQTQARVAELTAAVQVAELPARKDERLAQQSNAQAASEVLRQSTWRTTQKQQSAPAAAVVADVFFRPGEFVPAGQPVLSLLPPENLKARFFVPESDVAQLHPGQNVTLACDGCGQPMVAQVTRIATQPEFTPPVIYSNAQRNKLVFMVEAKPKPADAQRLRPGQPLDVRVATATAPKP